MGLKGKREVPKKEATISEVECSIEQPNSKGSEIQEPWFAVKILEKRGT